MRESPCRYTMIVAGASYLKIKLFLLSKHYSGTGRNVEFQPLFLFFTVQRIGNSKSSAKPFPPNATSSVFNITS